MVYTIGLEFGDGRRRSLGSAPTFDDAVLTLNGIIGIPGYRLSPDQDDRRRMTRDGEVWETRSPRKGSSTVYKVRNAG